MDVLPSPLGSHAKPIRGPGLNKCPFIQLDGTPFFPHCTRPFSRRGSGLFGFSGIGVQELSVGMVGSAQEGRFNRTPVKGSTAPVAARDWLNALASQLYAWSYFSCQVPNKLTRRPMLTVNRGETFQLSWI